MMTPKTKYEQLLEAHTREEEGRFASIDNQLEIIRVNHLAHIEAEQLNMGRNIATLVANYAWIKWIVTTTLGAVMVGVIAAVLTLITK
jgi:hypothetical protein